MSTYRVVCAAIRAADGDVLLGIRHYSRDMRAQMEVRSDGAKFQNRTGADQGFVDQYGNYMTREQAYNLANYNGQIHDYSACIQGIDDVKKLTSEGLY